MIFVKRTPTPAHLNLRKRTSAAAVELKEARDYYKTHKKPIETKHYKAYADLSVRDALRTLFHSKCAYCESEISNASQDDIEHFRPKGRVSNAEAANFDHPGYWWVAMYWENLVLSCMHCNQSRKQLIIDPSQSVEEIKVAIKKNRRITRGKLDSFPTADNFWTKNSRDRSFSREKPLLIDPTKSDPSKHLKFRFNNVFCTLVPDNDSDRGKATIDVLGLNRRYLTESRAKRLSELTSRAANIRQYLDDIENAATDGEAEFAKRAIQNEVRGIREMGEARKPFAGLAQQFLVEVETMLEESIT